MFVVVFVNCYKILILRIETSEQDAEMDPRKQMADRRSLSRDLLAFIGNDKTWYKKCFLGAAGAQHARPDQTRTAGPDQNQISKSQCLRLLSVLFSNSYMFHFGYQWRPKI